MKINHAITFTLSKEEDSAYCTILGVLQHIVEDETVPKEISDRASNILNELYEFDNDYLTD